jgi:hypothetical protein
MGNRGVAFGGNRHLFSATGHGLPKTLIRLGGVSFKSVAQLGGGRVSRAGGSLIG